MSDTPEVEASAAMPDDMIDDMDEGFGDVLEVVAMHATTTAIGSVSTEEFDAEQCLIGNAAVEGDASIGTSVVGVVSADSVGIHQAAAAVIVVGGDASIDQGGAQVIVAQTVGIDQGGAAVLVAGEANLARSWVGVMAARNATLSDDSRVIIDTRAALIIGGLLFGGLGLVACAVFMGARRVAMRMPRLPFAGRHGHGMHGMPMWSGHGRPSMPHIQMPDLPKMPDMPKMPDLSKIDLSAIADMVSKLRRAG
jgi:hypothetical protein